MKMPPHCFTLLSFFILFFIPLGTQASPPSTAYGSPVLNHDFGENGNIRNSHDLETNYDWGLFWGQGNPNNPVANLAEWQRYTPLTSNNYLFTSNTLKLIARFNKNNGDNRISKGEITSGCIRSKKKFKPTSTKSIYFEASMKVPNGKGLWPAFWLYRHAGGGDAEIDIVEIVNNKWDSSKTPHWKPLAYHNNLHYRNGKDNPYESGKQRTPLSSGYHIWGAEWTAKGVSFYLDGKHLRTESYPLDNASTGWGGSNPADILISLAAGGGWPGNADDKAAYLATLEVDYLRVYEKSGGGSSGGGGNGGAGGSTDNIASVSGPANIKRGQRVTVAIKYNTKTPRTIVAAFQLARKPWTTYKGATASKNVAAGSGTASLTFMIPDDVPLGTNYQYQSYITETNKGWNERKNFKEQTAITVVKEKENNNGNADNIIWASGPTNIKRGQHVTVKVKYKASVPRKIVSVLQLARFPWTTYKGATASTNVKAGKGIANLTFTIPKHVPLGKHYHYQNYITEQNRGWNKRKGSKENGAINVVR